MGRGCFFLFFVFYNFYPSHCSHFYTDLIIDVLFVSGAALTCSEPLKPRQSLCKYTYFGTF